jgi:hypothetical protein
VGDRGVQHCRKIFLANDVVVYLILRDVHKLDHFTLVIILKNGRSLEAEIKILFACIDHVYLLDSLNSIEINKVIEAIFR